MELEERQNRLLAFFEKAPMKKTFGMSCSFVGESAHFVMPYQSQFNHALGGIHGGVIATMLDNAGWFTAAQYYDTWIATVNLDVKYLEPCVCLDLRATGHLIKKGRSLAFCSMKLRDGQNRVLAYATGTFAVTKKEVSHFS